MKKKHIEIRIEQCLSLRKLSECKRRKVGALLLDPVRNVILCDGYNGTARGGSDHCGDGRPCERERLNIESGTRMEIGFCIHAEQNVICNAAANGIKTSGAWLLVSTSPCINCAKLIHQCGV